MSFRKIIKFISVAGVASAMAYACCVFGYLQGYTDGTNAPANACYNVSVLESIRRGDNATALKLLDTHLDGNIVYHWALNKRGRSMFDVIGFGKYDKSFMERVATYRKQLPLDNSDHEINGAIASVLHQYSTNKMRRKRGKPSPEVAPDQEAVR